MAVSLRKGQRINLTKDAGLKNALVGLGWDTNRYDGSEEFDLDLVLFMLGKDGKVVDDRYIIYYGKGHDKDPEEAIFYSGDNRNGEGDGDDESVVIDFSKISPIVNKIVVAVTIYDATVRNQNFGMVDNSYIRFVNTATGEETHNYPLCENFSIQKSVIFGEFYKNGNDWNFKAVGEGYDKELEDLCIEYGLEVDD